MADYGLGATFLPGSEEQRRKRPQLQGDALRVLAMTLPGALGPGAVAPDLLLNAPGMAGQPAMGGGGGASPLAALIAEAIVNQMTGAGSQGPLAGMQQQVAPSMPVAAPSVGPAAQLRTPSSLSNVVRTEAQRPTAQTAVGAPQAAPSITGAAPSPLVPPAAVQEPPRVIADPVPPEGGGGEGEVPDHWLIGGPDPIPDPPFDLGGLMRTMDALFRRGGKYSGGGERY